MKYSLFLCLLVVNFFTCTPKTDLSNAYNVYELGVAPNSTEVQTSVLQSVIDDISQKNGGTLVIPYGEIVSGSIELKPNVSIRIDGNAVLKASSNIKDYTTQFKDKLIFIYGHQLTSISITGQGTIDGQGALFWDDDFKPLDRPTPWILFRESRNINIEDVTFTNSPSHTFRLEDSELITFENIKIINPFEGPNTDGIDIVDSKNIFINNSFISTGDDAICLKSQRDTVENVVVTNTILESDDAAIKFGTGSRVATRYCKFDNITIRNTRYGISLFMLDGGIFEHNTFRNITIETNSRHKYEYPIFIDIDKRVPDRPYGKVNHNVFSDITIHSGGKILITGHPESAITNLTIQNIQFNVDVKQDFSTAKKPRGNKNYPKLATSLDLSPRPEHFVFGYIDGLRLKLAANYDMELNQEIPLSLFYEEVVLAEY